MTDSTEIRYICHPGEPYDRFAIEDWVKAKRAAGTVGDGPVSVRVEHPDREADGSCRWCGDTRNDVVLVP